MIVAPFLFDVLALVGGKIHTQVPGAAALEASIVIEGDRIVSVRADGSAPPDARRVDLHGMHVVPGLIDGLAYHDAEHDALYTLAGVTTICDHGNELGRIFDSRERADRDTRHGPSLWIAGGVFDGVPPATDAAITVRSVDEVKGAVEQLVAEKVDFLAHHAQISHDAWSALATESSERKLGLWGPRPTAVTLDDFLASQEHGVVGLDSFLPPGKRWDSFQLEGLDAPLKTLVERGMAVIPELNAAMSRVADQGDHARELDDLSPQYAALWQFDLDQRRKLYDAEARRKAETFLGSQRALLVAMQRAGVALVPGSGAPHPWLMPGAGLVAELVAWQAAGVAASDCLAAATRGAAQAFDMSDRGTIEAGKLADLVIVRGDPTQSVQALADVEGVVLRGAWLDREALDKLHTEHTAMLEAARKQANAPIEVDAPKLPEGTVLLSGLTETQTPAGRIAAERFAIVREVDEMVTFVGRRRVLGTPATPERTVDVRQRLRNGNYDSFEVKVSGSGHEAVVRGQQVGGQWRVERRYDQQFVDIQAAREAIVGVDCGSVTTFLMLAQTQDAGHFPIVRLDEGLQLEVVRWDLALDDDGDHAFRTPAGLCFAGFEENGAIKAVYEQLGTGASQTTLMELDVHGGPGLPLPEKKLALMRKKAAGEPGGDGKK